jgi:hypothetical protein
MPARYFTLDEANRHVPALEQTFARVMQIRAQLKTLYKRLEDKRFAPADEHFSVTIPGAPPDVIRDRASFKALVETLREEIESVHETGCVIKDVETGLVDWPAQREGREICLCWRYGEKAIAWWHDLESGFAGRRPVSELSSQP